MYRLKDLRYLDIYDCKGKRVGSIDDVAIDYYGKKIKGFTLASKFFSKRNYIPIENILTMGDTIIIEGLSSYNGLTFERIKGFNIINKTGEMLGILEDILINENDFSIRGLITATGFFDKFIHGKKILLINETILGEDNILYFGNKNITLKSIPHNFLKQEENNVQIKQKE